MTTAALVGRVGGLALALGVGAAVGTALAAPASASPRDSAASASADAKPGGAAAGRAHTRSADSLRVAPAASTVKTPRPQPKPPDSPAPAVLTAALAVGRDVEQRATASVTPQPIRLPVLFTESVPWPATNVPPGTGIKATPKTPGSVHVGFKDQYTIFKNIPFSFPRTPAFFLDHVSGDAQFTDNSVYNLNNVDQFDWNKLTGISFNFFRPDENALMVAWRYNVTAKDFEIAPYYNVNLARILPVEPAEVISVPIGAKFTFSVDYQGITLSYGNQTVFKPIPAGLHPNQLTAFRIQPWFGGTSLPPTTLTLYLHVK